MSIKELVISLAVLALLASHAAAQEDIFNISNKTGMTPGVPPKDSGVWSAPASPGPLANVAGAWTLALNDDLAARSLKLTLYQNNDAVFGSGDITVLGNTNVASAGGILTGSRLTLYVLPSGDPGLYVINLIVGPGSMNGNYVFSTPGAAQLSGVVSGSQTEAQTVTIVKSTSTTATQLGDVQPAASDKPKGPKGTAV